MKGLSGTRKRFRVQDEKAMKTASELGGIFDPNKSLELELTGVTRGIAPQERNYVTNKLA